MFFGFVFRFTFSTPNRSHDVPGNAFVPPQPIIPFGFVRLKIIVKFFKHTQAHIASFLFSLFHLVRSYPHHHHQSTHTSSLYP